VIAALLVGLALAGEPAGGVEAVTVSPASLAEPTDAELIYLNARLALREGRSTDALRHWFLRTSHNDLTDRVSRFDRDFVSLTWVALGDLGVCQDGLDLDHDGAGLWPLALHNLVVRSRGRRTAGSVPRSFRSFDVGQQQRPITIDDVLDHQELRSVDFIRGRCLLPHLVKIEAGGIIHERLRDRRIAAYTLEFLLDRGKVTLDPERVRGAAVLDARLFDLHLQILALDRRAMRRQVSVLARTGRMLGLSRAAVRVMRADAPEQGFRDDSIPAQILRDSATWPVSEWMSLTPDRRVFLFDQARTYLGDDNADLERVALGILDELISQGQGAEVRRWIPRAAPDPSDRQRVWGGERGARLLALDRDSGFDERAVIALQRGVHALQAGAPDRALRSLAYAIQLAPESDASEVISGLSLRWLSYVSARFELTRGLLLTLQELLPPRAYSQILEDLMWTAAFRADEASFQRGLRAGIGRGALQRRLALLVPLSRGDTRAFSQAVAQGLQESPSGTLRFLDQLVQRLELEEPAVRQAQRPTLVEVRALLEPLADPTARSRQGRQAMALQDRTLALLEGLGGVGEDGSDRDRARRLDPAGEIFAGAVRLAPSDPLPWPFRALEATPPSPFEPLLIRPVEWRNADGDWVLGWSIRG